MNEVRLAFALSGAFLFGLSFGVFTMYLATKNDRRGPFEGMPEGEGLAGDEDAEYVEVVQNPSYDENAQYTELVRSLPYDAKATGFLSSGWAKAQELLKEEFNLIEDTSAREMFEVRPEHEEYDWYEDEGADVEDDEEVDIEDGLPQEAPAFDARLNPIVITFDDFVENQQEYDKISLTYYEADDTLCDEDDKPIEDPNKLLGSDALTNFGHGSYDPDTVYVRNDNLQSDFEVCRLWSSYVESVLGYVDHEEKPRPKKMREKYE